eukprot:403336707
MIINFKNNSTTGKMHQISQQVLNTSQSSTIMRKPIQLQQNQQQSVVLPTVELRSNANQAISNKKSRQNLNINKHPSSNQIDITESNQNTTSKGRLQFNKQIDDDSSEGLIVQYVDRLNFVNEDIASYTSSILSSSKPAQIIKPHQMGLIKQIKSQQQALNNQNQTISRQLNRNFNNQNQSANHTMVVMPSKNIEQTESQSSSPNIYLKKASQYYHKRSETATELIQQNTLHNTSGLADPIRQQYYQTIIGEEAIRGASSGSSNIQSNQQQNLTQNALFSSSGNSKIAHKNNEIIFSKLKKNQAKMNEDQSSVKNILKKIALQNSSVASISQTPQYHHQKSISNEGNLNYYQTQSSNTIKVNNQLSKQKIELISVMSTKNQQSKHFIIKKDIQALPQKNQDRYRSFANTQNPQNQIQYNGSPNAQSPSSLKVAMKSIRNNNQQEQQLAYMTLKTQKQEKQSNHSSNQNIRMSQSSNAQNLQTNQQFRSDSLSHHQTFENFNFKNDSLMTPEIINSKIVTILPTFARQSLNQSQLKRKETFQKNLQNNVYFQDETNFGANEDTPSFQKGYKILNFPQTTKHSLTKIRPSESNKNSILPKIIRQKTSESDLKVMPRNYYQGQKPLTSQNTYEGSQIDIINESAKSVNNQKQQQATYYKMIQKLIKQPGHLRNNTTQINSQNNGKAATFSETVSQQSFHNQLSQNPQLQRKHDTPQQIFKNSDKSIRAISNENDIRQEHNPHFNIFHSTIQSQINNEDQQDESPFMNDNRKQLKQVDESDSDQNNSSIYQASRDRKKSIVQSYQNQPIICQITPQYDKRGAGNQLQSVIQINQFKQSLDNKSTEMSSKQEQISRYNSGQIIPIIPSVQSSQIKSTISQTNQNFSSMSGTNYQQLLQKMISIRDSNSGKSPQENLMKQSISSKGQKGQKKATSLIKEDSNEEKSSSNSNSNQEIIIDPKVQPIKKDDLFTKKLKVLLSKKHRRQKTAQLQQVFGQFQQSLVERRYQEDVQNLNQSEAQRKQIGMSENFNSQVNSSQESLRTMIVVSDRDLKIDKIKDGCQSEYLMSEASLALRDINFNQKQGIDKQKHWLLDSSRFDYDQQNVNQQLISDKKRNLDDDISDTVEFDRDNSSQETPPHISKKGNDLSTGTMMKKELSESLSSPTIKKIKQSTQSPGIRLARQSILTFQNTSVKLKDQSNLITIDRQDEEPSELINQSNLNNSLIIDKILSAYHTAEEFKEREKSFLLEIYQQLNVENQEKILLFPKFRLPSLDNFFQPSYYDTIYLQQANSSKAEQPILENDFCFD